MAAPSLYVSIVQLILLFVNLFVKSHCARLAHPLCSDRLFPRPAGLERVQFPVAALIFEAGLLIMMKYG